MAQFRHGQRALALIQTIPDNSSVAATTGLIPHLANREVLIRFPYHDRYQNQDGQPVPVEWVAADLHNQRLFQTFRKQRKGLKRNLRQLNELSNQGYGVVAFDDDVVLLQQQAQTDAGAQQAFTALSELLNF